MHIKIGELMVSLFALCACNFSDVVSAETESGIVTWHEVKALKDNTTVLLVDVREPNELIETGTIPGSINIPVDTLENTLKNLPATEFLEKYHREKPKLDTILVFSCTVGVRSANAQNIARKLGYINAKNYLGSWSDWASHLNQ